MAAMMKSDSLCTCAKYGLGFVPHASRESACRSSPLPGVSPLPVLVIQSSRRGAAAGEVGGKGPGGEFFAIEAQAGLGDGLGAVGPQGPAQELGAQAIHTGAALLQ